jgi:hypothetical protein
VLDDSVMRDAMMKMCDLRISVLHAGTSRMRLSNVVYCVTTNLNYCGRLILVPNWIDRDKS